MSRLDDVQAAHDAIEADDESDAPFEALRDTEHAAIPGLLAIARAAFRYEQWGDFKALLDALEEFEAGT